MLDLQMMMRCTFRAAALLAAGLALSLGAASAAGATSAKKDEPPLRFLGEVQFPTGLVFDGTQVGGLSGIDYDPRPNLYYAISDDRSQINPARFYELTIDLSDGALADGDVVLRRVVTILTEQGVPFAPLSLDPESIRFDPTRRTLFWTSEGDANALVPPFVREMKRDGRFVQELETPAKYDPTADNASGIRNNLAFENFTLQGTAASC
jgi:3-phytase